MTEVSEFSRSNLFIRGWGQEGQNTQNNSKGRHGGGGVSEGDYAEKHPRLLKYGLLSALAPAPAPTPAPTLLSPNLQMVRLQLLVQGLSQNLQIPNEV